MTTSERRRNESGQAPDSDLPAVSLSQLSPLIRGAAQSAGWAELMPVQTLAIPYLLAGKDLMVQSRTGSGKTGAFILPMIDRIDAAEPTCQALVLVPTRELALQVGGEAVSLAAGAGIRCGVLYGGVGYGAQLDALKNGAHLVVGTPGRILDHLYRGTLSLDRLRILVFDEADRLLSVGFYPDMKQLRGYLPPERAGYMFSATYTSSVHALAREFLHEPHFLCLSQEVVHAPETLHAYYPVPSMDKDRCMVRLIEVENPESAIIFCNTKARVSYVAQVLKRFGYDADALSADLAQAAREEVMRRVRERTLRFLVATDVAARGIDIINLSHVFLYDQPEDPESYVHRTGRTGRAGAAGIAISLVDVFEEAAIERVAARFGIPIERRRAPSDQDVAEIAAQRVTALLEAKLRQRDKLQVERMERFLPLARNFGESEDEIAVLAMLLDDFYQASLHAPSVTTPPPKREVRVSGGRPPSGRRRRRS